MPPRHVGRDSLLEIGLDNGEVIHATPDHDFMLRDGRMLPAGALRSGQSLMPLYRDMWRGYRDVVYQPLNGYLVPDASAGGRMESARRLLRGRTGNASSSRRFRPSQQSADQYRAHAGVQTTFDCTTMTAMARGSIGRHTVPRSVARSRVWRVIRYGTSDSLPCRQSELVSSGAIRGTPKFARLYQRRGAIQATQHATVIGRQRWRAIAIPTSGSSRLASVPRMGADDGTRRKQQAEIARAIRIRPDITTHRSARRCTRQVHTGRCAVARL